MAPPAMRKREGEHMPTTEEAYEWLKANAPEEVFQALETPAIREENKRLAAKVAELEPQVNELASLKRTPLIEKALGEHAKVDVSKIAPKVLEALQRDLGDTEPTAEWAAQAASDYGLPVSDANQTPSQQSPAAQMTGQALGAATANVNENEAFYAELDAVADGDTEGVRKVLAKHGRAPAEPTG